MVTVSSCRSYGWVSKIGQLDEKHQLEAGGETDYSYLILSGHCLSELSRHHTLEIFFQVFSFNESCILSDAKLPPPPSAISPLPSFKPPDA